MKFSLPLISSLCDYFSYSDYWSGGDVSLISMLMEFVLKFSKRREKSVVVGVAEGEWEEETGVEFRDRRNVFWLLFETGWGTSLLSFVASTLPLGLFYGIIKLSIFYPHYTIVIFLVEEFLFVRFCRFLFLFGSLLFLHLPLVS